MSEQSQEQASQLDRIFEVIKALDKPREFVRYVAQMDSRTTDRCRRLNRKVWQAQEFPPTFEPPIHYNCRCRLEPFTATLRNQMRTKGFTDHEDARKVRTSQPPRRPEIPDTRIAIAKIFKSSIPPSDMRVKVARHFRRLNKPKR